MMLRCQVGSKQMIGEARKRKLEYSLCANRVAQPTKHSRDGWWDELKPLLSLCPCRNLVCRAQTLWWADL